MSELKAILATPHPKMKNACDGAIEVYPKSEADKAIAEKDKVIAELKSDIADLRDDKKSTDAILDERNAEIAELKEERRWRKFPDEKPEWGKEVLVVDDESKHYIVRFSHDMKWISWGKMNTCESNRAKYWMPLPKTPEK